MAKKRGVPQLKNWIKRKQTGPTPPQKTRLTSHVVAQADKPSSLWDENSSEEGLEDTPVSSMQSAVPTAPAEIPAASLQPTEPTEKAEVTAARVEHLMDTTQKRTVRKHRKAFSPNRAFGAAAAGISHVFTAANKKSTGHAAALEFAENRKRVGRKGRKNRRVLVYAGSALVVAVVMLLVFLVPGGAAAPVDARTSESGSGGTVAVNPTVSTGVKGSAIATDSGVTDSATVILTPSPTPSPTPIPTTAADPTENPIDIDELVDDFVVVANKYYDYSNNHYEYTEEDVHILAQLIYGEARGESTTGKVAVANVVMNRVLCRGAWGNSVKAVVTAPGQFTGYKSTITPTRACINAARQVLQNELWVIPQDIYYFRSGAAADVDWGSHKFYKKIGGHCFYRHNYYGRMRGGDVPPAMFKRVYKYAQLGCEPEKRVYRIQYMLDALGYKIEKVDSYFGEGTEKALIKFQQDHGLDDDGVAGPATVRKLIDQYGLRDYYIKFCT